MLLERRLVFMLQAEKTDRTHRELCKAAVCLFTEKGFAHTSIADIVSLAGYSTGAFYRHFKAKSAILQELWSAFSEDFISDSIAGARQKASLREAMDYLVLRSREYYSHPMTICYLQAGGMQDTPSGQRRIPVGAKDFTGMLFDLLYQAYPQAEVARLRTFASALHAVINAFSAGELLEQDFYFDENVTREILLMLAEQAGL